MSAFEVVRPGSRNLGGLVALAVFFGSTSIASAACVNAAADPQVVPAATIEQSTLCLLNEERRKVGQPALRTSARLGIAAEAHGRDMAEHRYFAHDSLDGRSFVDRIKQSGYLTPKPSNWTVGENLAWGSGSLATPDSIVRAWMASPAHRRNILTADFREIGLSNTDARESSRTIYVTKFGSRS